MFWRGGRRSWDEDTCRYWCTSVWRYIEQTKESRQEAQEGAGMGKDMALTVERGRKVYDKVLHLANVWDSQSQSSLFAKVA